MIQLYIKNLVPDAISNFEIFKPTDNNGLIHLGYFDLYHNSKDICFRDIIDIESHPEIAALQSHGRYRLIEGFRGDVGFRDESLGDIVFKRDFVWRYPQIGHWTILAFYKKLANQSVK